MADYQTMYTTLFNAVTDAISLLQQAQQRTEQIYTEGEDTIFEILETDVSGGDVKTDSPNTSDML